MTTETTHATFLGLGKMGLSMARHLSTHGVQLTVWNRTNLLEKTSATEVFAGFGLKPTVASSATEAIRANKVVFLMLWDAQSFHEVLAQLAPEDYADRIFISHITISPKESSALNVLVTSKGGRFVEAPVLGNATVAERGTLQTLVGCNRDLYDKFETLFRSWGTPRYLGPVGSATATKLAQNYILGANLTAFAASYGYLQRKGVDLEMFLTILTNGPFNLSGGYHKVWADRFAKRQYEPAAFAAAGLSKDLSLALEEFETAGIHSAIAEAMATVVEHGAEEKGFAALDMTSVYEIVNPKIVAAPTENAEKLTH